MSSALEIFIPSLACKQAKYLYSNALEAVFFHLQLTIRRISAVDVKGLGDVCRRQYASGILPHNRNQFVENHTAVPKLRMQLTSRRISAIDVKGFGDVCRGILPHNRHQVSGVALVPLLDVGAGDNCNTDGARRGPANTLHSAAAAAAAVVAAVVCQHLMCVGALNNCHTDDTTAIMMARAEGRPTPCKVQ
jgi:hypothetical protein